MKTTPTSEIPQIEAMRLGVNYQQIITVRGLSFPTRPLSMGESLRVAQEVALAIQALPDVARNPLQEHALLATKTLCLASTSDVGANDAVMTEFILDRFTTEELQYAYKQYVDACDRSNPALETISEDDLRTLIALVKKNPSVRTGLSRSQLLSLVAHFSQTNDA